MKIMFATAAIVVALGAPAFAQSGNIHGNESRGAPVNSSYRATAVDASTGRTPGYRANANANAKVYVKKKKHVRARGSVNMQTGN